MTARKSKLAHPPGLAAEGVQLWQEITDELAASGLVLDARERRWLLDACREADLAAAIAASLEGQPHVVMGSTKQPVAHPLIAELRQHRLATSMLLARLRLDDPADASGSGPHRYDSTHAREAAYARWRARG